MATTDKPKYQVVLKDVRLSYPQLFKAKGFEDSEPRFSAAFLLDKVKDKAQIAAVKVLIGDLLKEKNKGKELSPEKVCLRDGATKDADGYGDGIMFISASNLKRPQVVDRGRHGIAEEDGIIYGGCYVNAVVNLWFQDNKFGKRVNASLEAVQFLKDGEPFGQAPVKTDEVFENLDDDDV